VLSGRRRHSQLKGADRAMKNIVFSAVAAVIGCLLVSGNAFSEGEKVDIAKLPKAVVDTLMSKYPKGVLKKATMEKVDGKVVYEVQVNLAKDHVHVVVAAEGKLLEIHRHIDPKDLPEKVVKAVTAKYPKGKIDEAEEQTDPDGKVIGYEVVVELDPNNNVIIQLDPAGKIEKETKETIKKAGK
jgi:hypothetical protein